MATPRTVKMTAAEKTTRARPRTTSRATGLTRAQAPASSPPTITAEPEHATPSVKQLPPSVVAGLQTHPAAPYGEMSETDEKPVRDTSLVVFGGALLVVGVTVFFLLFSLPWYEFSAEGVPDGAGITRDRDSINAETAYQHVMFTWPFVSLLALGLFGTLLAAAQFVPERYGKAARRLQVGLWSVIGIFSFLLLLAGVRLLADWLVSLMGESVAELTLLASPWLILGTGIVVFVTAAFLVAPEVALWWSAPATGRGQRVAAVTALVAAGFLLVSPFLPNLSLEFGQGADTQVSHVNEAGLSNADGFLPLEKVGDDLNWTRLMIWFLGGLSLVSIGMEALRQKMWIPGDLKPLLRTYYLTAIPIIVATVFTFLYYVHLADAVADNPGISVGLNHLPALALLGFIALYALYLMDSLRGPSSGTPATA